MQKAFSTIKMDCFVDLLSVHQSNPTRYPHLLESVAHGEKNSRYSILFAFPQSTIRLNDFDQLSTDTVSIKSKKFLDGFNEWFQQEMISGAVSSNKLPFTGGWFVYLGYELAQEIEPSLSLPLKSTLQLPIAFATRFPAAIINDRETQSSWLVAESAFYECVAVMQKDITAVSPINEPGQLKLTNSIEENASKYINAVKKIQSYIVEGDVFQVNVSRLWQFFFAENFSSAEIYLRLRKSNPAPFAGLLTSDDFAVISSSPERLVSVKNGNVQTRPIAGTRPRVRKADGSLNEIEDQVLKDELIKHPKERAEHVMLIDLERNDLGRVCEPGSLHVDELMALESYEHVHHIVSNVSGKLKENILPGDVLRAVFPGGTITGCPKVRCMEIIAELEASPRHAYTGSMGYINRNGDMDFNILIRTIVRSGNELHIRAGAGIVAYSDAEKELQETRVKAKGMLNAITG